MCCRIFPKQGGPGAESPKRLEIVGSSAGDAPTNEASPAETHVVVRVLKAELTKNFALFGKMDLFTSVKWQKEGGSFYEMGRTHTHWDGHFNPQWDHTCPGQPYSGNDKLQFDIYEKDLIGPPTFCCSSDIEVDELLGDAIGSQDPEGGLSKQGRTHRLTLSTRQGDTCGNISVQANLVELSRDTIHDAEGRYGIRLTRVDDDRFHRPVHRLDVSGGTAPFFSLRLKNPKDGQTEHHYIGKDLSRAEDEIKFYEQALANSKLPPALAPRHLIDFMLEYSGVFTSEVHGEKSLTKELLVMRNMRDGCKSLRLLDIKIGQKTAQAGWQGKSYVAYLRQSIVDGVTNSMCEGFRLEGFDGLPQALDSMDALLDFGGSDKNAKTKISKKAKRFMLQLMPGAEIFMYFIDLHMQHRNTNLEEFLHPTELAELVLHEIVCKLVLLCVACRQSPVPQKWIGSSVALGYDAGDLPSRSLDEAEVRKQVRVKIFDWGRSEFNTYKRHSQFDQSDAHDRALYWGYYVGGVDRLAWEAARTYRNRFGSHDGWQSLQLSILDFDSTKRHDAIGRATISPLEECEERVATLEECSVRSATITYSVAWKEFPEGSRVKGVWAIRIHRARGLPMKDKVLLKTTSDPFVEVVALSKDGNLCHRQRTSVHVGTNDPVWDEELDIPVAAKAGLLEEGLRNEGGSVLAEGDMGKILHPEEHLMAQCGRDQVYRSSSEKVDIAEAWEDLLDHALGYIQDKQEANTVNVLKLVRSETRRIDDMSKVDSDPAEGGMQVVHEGGAADEDVDSKPVNANPEDSERPEAPLVENAIIPQPMDERPARLEAQVEGDARSEEIAVGPKSNIMCRCQ